MVRTYWLMTLISCLVNVLADSDCYSDDLNPYKYFASKTSYDTVRSKKLRIDDVPNCEPVLVWGMFRHGTRYPHDFEIKEQMSLRNLRDAILRNHDISPHNGQLCFEDLLLLREWNYSVKLTDADHLTSSGVNEMYLLGKRLKSDFPLLNTNYSEDKFKIRFTDKIRTKQSADAFTRGLFGTELSLPDSFINGTLLEPNSNCSTFEKSTKSEGLREKNHIFRNSYLVKTLVADVSKRLGFDSQLSFKNMKDMYDMCRFDNAWYPNDKSPWCSVFTNEQLKIMEYDEDLAYYYRSGYGNPFTLMLGCPLVRDLIETLNRRTLVNTSEEASPSTILYFSHSLTLRALLIGLGMAHDITPITPDFNKASDKRQWRTSFITPFAGNLVAVLYKCGDDYKVIFYLNEQYVDYEGCNVGLCNWTYIYDRFLSRIDPEKCNLDFCSPTSSASIFAPSFVIPILISLGLTINKIF